MRAVLNVLTLGLALAFIAGSGFSVEAATSRKAGGQKFASKKARATKAKGSKKNKEASGLSSSHNFDDHSVTGEYQMPDEALAKVENEKSLSDLLGVRKHFKDRLLEASEQE